MERLNILSVIIFVPLLGAFAMLFLKSAKLHKKLRLAKSIALLVSGFTLISSINLLAFFESTSSEFQFVEKYSWLPQFGINYIVGVDGISLFLVLLAAFLIFLAIVVSKADIESSQAYFGMLLLLETGILGALLALDGIAFYAFWGAMLIPIYFLISIWGGENREEIARKFVIFSMAGSLMMLVAIIYLGVQTGMQLGEYSFLFSDWNQLQLSVVQEVVLFVAFVLAFAITMPIFPLHGWLRSVYVAAPTAVTIILACVLSKLGIYGLIRFCTPVFSQVVALSLTTSIFICLGCVTIIYGILMAWRQTNLKSLLAYLSFSYMGFCVLGYGAMNIEGMQGAILQMISHGLIIAGLFLLVDSLHKRYGTYEISEIQVSCKTMPIFSCLLLVFLLALAAFPLTSEFVSRLLILLAMFKSHYVFGLLATFGVVLCIVFVLSMYSRIVFGNGDAVAVASEQDKLLNSSRKELTIFVSLLILIFVIGIRPQPLFNVTDLSTRALLNLENN